jgi:hypothetical protein
MSSLNEILEVLFALDAHMTILCLFAALTSYSNQIIPESYRVGTA